MKCYLLICDCAQLQLVGNVCTLIFIITLWECVCSFEQIVIVSNPAVYHCFLNKVIVFYNNDGLMN